MTPTPEVRDIDVTEAHHRASDGSALLLDVREADEWAGGRTDLAVHVPLGALDPTAVPKDRPVLALCRSGNRSRTAAAQLAAAGHDVVNVAGGMRAWQAAGLPMTSDHGTPDAG